MNLRALIAGKRCVYVPESVVRHKVGGSIGREPNPTIATTSVRNQYLVIGKNLPAELSPIAALGWLWHTFRNTVPLRPSKWHLMGRRLKETRERMSTQSEGLRLGLEKRADVWARRRVSRREIIRWLLRGVGPV
jgi:GT2 family glycosyltransferase